jgi:AcrR family transcriptional regulator
MTTTGSKTREPGSLTERGLRTRAALLAAARVVFERDGFVSARITDIAETAGVAHGSFYSYFVSKEEIFRAVVAELQAELTRSRREHRAGRVAPTTLREVVLDANRRYLKTWQSHTDLMRLWEDVAILDEEVMSMFDETRMAFVRRAEAAMKKLQSDGLVDPKIDTRVASFALTAMVSRFAYVWFTRRDDHDFDHAADQLTRLWLNALGVAESEWDRPLDGARS